MMKTHFFFLFFAISICLSCEKDPEPVARLSKEVLAYTYFPEGSYWIYEDSITGSIDSIHAISARMKAVKKGGERWERTWQNFYSSYRNDTVYGGSTAELWYSNKRGAYYMEITKNFGTNLAFFEAKEIGEKLVIFDRTPTFYESFLPKYTQDGNSYDSVKVFLNTTYNLKMFFVKEIGVIRKEYEGSLWKLKKYHLEK